MNVRQANASYSRPGMFRALVSITPAEAQANRCCGGRGRADAHRSVAQQRRGRVTSTQTHCEDVGLRARAGWRLGEGPLDAPATPSEPGPAFGGPASDHRRDAAASELATLRDGSPRSGWHAVRTCDVLRLDAASHRCCAPKKCLQAALLGGVRAGRESRCPFGVRRNRRTIRLPKPKRPRFAGASPNG